MKCLVEHGAQIDVQNKVSDERYLSFIIDARVIISLLYENDISKAILHFIVHVNLIRLKPWNAY